MARLGCPSAPTAKPGTKTSELVALTATNSLDFVPGFTPAARPDRARPPWHLVMKQAASCAAARRQNRPAAASSATSEQAGRGLPGMRTPLSTVRRATCPRPLQAARLKAYFFVDLLVFPTFVLDAFPEARDAAGKVVRSTATCVFHDACGAGCASSAPACTRTIPGVPAML